MFEQKKPPSVKNAAAASHTPSQPRTTKATWADASPQNEEKKITKNEWTSLSALIAYVAYNSGDYEFNVERRVADRFNVPNISCLAALNYDAAVRYLVEMIP